MNSLKFASDQLKDNKDYVLRAVTLNGADLKYASTNLRNDKEIVMIALKNYHNIIRKSIEKDFENRAYTLLMVEMYGFKILDYYNNFDFDDDEVLITLQDNDHSLLFYISEELKVDKDVALFAMKIDPETYKDLPIIFENDEDILLHAIEYKFFLYNAPNVVRDNRKIVLDAVKRHGEAIYYISDRLYDDEEIILESLKHNGRSLRKASDRLKDNVNIVLEAIKSTALSIEYASERIRDDYDIGLLAVQKQGNSISYLSTRLKNDRKIVTLAMRSIINIEQDKYKYIKKMKKLGDYKYNLHLKINKYTDCIMFL